MDLSPSVPRGSPAFRLFLGRDQGDLWACRMQEGWLGPKLKQSRKSHPHDGGGAVRTGEQIEGLMVVSVL